MCRECNGTEGGGAKLVVYGQFLGIPRGLRLATDFRRGENMLTSPLAQVRLKRATGGSIFRPFGCMNPDVRRLLRMEMESLLRVEACWR